MIKPQHLSAICIAAIGLFLLWQGWELGAPMRDALLKVESKAYVSVASATVQASMQLNGVLLQLGGAACLTLACLLPLKR